MASILLIGAGIAGLTAARELTKQGHTVTVLDKGRGVGGRMATRRIDQSRADHGAQYFTAQSAQFQTFVEELVGQGITGIWPVKASADTALHYVGCDGMSAIPKYIAQSLTVMTGERVVRIEKITHESGNGWRAISETGKTFDADNLLITIPAPQALTLLRESDIGSDEVDLVALGAIQYSPCITVMAVLNRPSHIPTPGAIRPDQSPIAWVADNLQKGISPTQTALTIQAGVDFSQTHFDDDLMTIGQTLIDLLPDLIPATDILTYQVHRWRYGFAQVCHPESFLTANTPAPLLFGGDGFGNSFNNIEGAFLSGLAMAEHLLDQLPRN